jgi:hypothetical protein
MAATLKCDTIQNAASTNPNITLDGSANATVGGTLAMGSSFKRNRIINGDMRVDQRNAGASGTGVGLYTVDRWAYAATQSSKGTWQQNAGAVTPPAGFTNYLGFTSSSAYSVLTGDTFYFAQPIEGYNVSDLDYGTASAKTVTLSFWVRSTGLSYPATFGGAIRNTAGNKSYLFSYSIPTTGTWTYISVPITGDTASAINTTTAAGLSVWLAMGSGSTYTSATTGSWIAGAFVQPTGTASVVGTNGATFYITGVQLEVGSVATPYERQIYSDQLAQCQRYYALNLGTVGFSSTTTIINYILCGPVSMRAAPSPSLFATSNVLLDYNVAYRNASSITLQTYQTTNGIEVNIVPSTATTGSKAQGISPNCVALSAEL